MSKRKKGDDAKDVKAKLDVSDAKVAGRVLQALLARSKDLVKASFRVLPDNMGGADQGLNDLEAAMGDVKDLLMLYGSWTEEDDDTLSQG